MKNITVENMTSTKGNKIANQFVIKDSVNNVVYFQSYQSIIVKIDNNTGKVFLDEKYWNYSNTTSRHRSNFLGESTKETRKKIADRIYVLTNLN